MSNLHVLFPLAVIIFCPNRRYSVILMKKIPENTNKMQMDDLEHEYDLLNKFKRRINDRLLFT